MDIYKMKLHERFTFEIEGTTTNVTRVPGGWLYRTDLNLETFVPFNNDLQSIKLTNEDLIPCKDKRCMSRHTAYCYNECPDRSIKTKGRSN
jgi:hypothetical protein